MSAAINKAQIFVDCITRVGGRGQKGLNTKQSTTKCERPLHRLPMAHLKVVFLVYREAWAEYVSHDEMIRLGVVDGHPIHAEVLRQQGFGVALYHILKYTNTGCLRSKTVQLVIFIWC